MTREGPTGLSSRSKVRILRLMPSDFFGRTGGSSGMSIASEFGVEFAVLLWVGCVGDTSGTGAEVDLGTGR
jgi:hypothetical protein